jgi:hypothetical protein
LEILFDLELEKEFLLMPSMVAITTAGLLLGARALGFRLVHFADEPCPPPRERGRLRFSIRGIMLLTLIVALISAGARSAENLSGLPDPTLVFVWSLCFTVVGLLALRAALGLDHRPGRYVLLFVLSPALGLFIALTASAHRDGWVYLITIMLMHPAVLLGSLGVVRSCGYHFGRSTAAELAMRCRPEFANESAGV